MPQRFLTSIWDRLKRPVLTASLRALSRWLGAERVSFVDGIVDAGYATYRTLATFNVSIESLFPVQLGRGPVPLASTPHFSFVKAHLGDDVQEWSKQDWKNYMTDQSAFAQAVVARRQERFEKLIEEISGNPHDVHLLVALKPGLRGFLIVDGFHRAAIVAACLPQSTVSCSLVSHIVA